jgi:hypothetical protein
MRVILSFACTPKTAMRLEKTIDVGSRSRFIEDCIKEKLLHLDGKKA